jgi:hypothetical protein
MSKISEVSLMEFAKTMMGMGFQIVSCSDLQCVNLEHFLTQDEPLEARVVACLAERR